MKKRSPSFFGGFLTAVLLLSLTTTALAATGKISYNFASIALNGETKIAAGTTITAANGRQVPGSILYTDEDGGKTNYLPIRAISGLLGVEISYDSATQTVLLGQQPGTVPAPAPQARWEKVIDGNSVTYQSSETGVGYDSVPLWQPTWRGEGWGLSSLTTDRKGVKYAMWRYMGGSGTLSLTCANPGGGSFGFELREPGENCRQITVQGCQADLYADTDSSFLVWENRDGVLFTLRGPDQDLLKQVAESIRPCAGVTPAQALSGLPKGYTLFERSAAGDTVNEIWMKDGAVLTWLRTTAPVAVPDGAPEAVTVNGANARYWTAKEAYEASGSTETVGSVIISSGIVPGAKSDDVNTLVWTGGGVNFRLQSILEKDTMLQIAENIT